MKEREKILKKFDGLCAYCGMELTLKTLHVDHIMPLYRGHSDQSLEGNAFNPKRIRGTDTIENKYPACQGCNQRKSDMTLEQFRAAVGNQVSVLRRNSAPFRLLERFAIIEIDEGPVKFFFEIFNDSPFNAVPGTCKNCGNPKSEHDEDTGRCGPPEG